MEMDIKSEDVHYHVRVYGRGQSLLLLHGFTGCGRQWEPFVERWKNHFQLICVDLLGHGQSASPQDPARYAMERTTVDLCNILDALQVERAHILGYSLGGRMALGLAMGHSERVKSLMLESASPGLPTQQEREERRQKDEQLADWIQKEGLEAFVSYWENIPLFETQKSLPDSIRLSIRKQRLHNDVQGLANSLRGIGTGVQPSYWQLLEHCSLPVCLVVGEEDRKFYHIATQMEKQLPYSTLKVIPEAGHAVHLEQPEAFCEVVFTHLEHHR